MPGQMLFNGVLFSIKWDRRARTDDLLRVNPIPIGYLNLLKSADSICFLLNPLPSDRGKPWNPVEAWGPCYYRFIYSKRVFVAPHTWPGECAATGISDAV